VSKKPLLKNGLRLPDLKRFKNISEEFLKVENQKAKIFARWELDFLWTRFRDLKVSDLYEIDTNELSVSEALIVKQLKNILATDDLTELNKVYDRLLGKPKEYREEKLIDNVELTIDVLKPFEEK